MAYLLYEFASPQQDFVSSTWLRSTDIKEGEIPLLSLGAF
jgi:hypothetical protein